MFENAGRTLFTALHAAAAARLEATHPCVIALAAAAADPAPERVAAAQAALAALPEADLTALMGAAHGALRSDPLAWLALWPGGGAARH